MTPVIYPIAILPANIANDIAKWRKGNSRLIVMNYPGLVQNLLYCRLKLCDVLHVVGENLSDGEKHVITVAAR